MKILVFSDLRSTHELPDVKADLVALLGYVPSKLVQQIDKKYDCMKVGLLSDKCHPTLYDGSSIVNLHSKVVEVEGVKIAGFGGVPLFNEEEPFGQYKEQDVEYFVKQLSVSNVDVLLSYTNLAYGDVKSPNAKNGFAAYNRIILEKLVTHLIHGRLHNPFERQIGEVQIHSVYPYAEIQIDK